MTGRAWRLPFGANPVAGGVEFRVWAPGRERVDVVLYGRGTERVHRLDSEGAGFFAARIEAASAGSRYRYRLDSGEVYPDPVSRSQPEGVHGASEVVDPLAHTWSTPAPAGLRLEDALIYELHVGTFTEGGTFDSAIERLDALRRLGITAVQLMPVAEFAGKRNWGYDGVYLFAPARAYGGAQALKRLVDAAHARGIAVLLDVVYNHFGPEGNYLPVLTGGRIFTEAYHTPWGAAVNFDGEGSAAVRELVVQNAIYWLHEYRIDGLRLDATHTILDGSPTHILSELSARVRATLPPGRNALLIAEDERNERRLVLPLEEGGYGLDAVWADDFHHQLRRLIAGDDEGYYRNYSGTLEHLAETLNHGWFFTGQRDPDHGAARGTPVEDVPPVRLVHAIQNHDQIGNRAHGERLHHEVHPGRYRAASALLLLTPYTPLLFMGQEWAASTPFLYFTDHPEELGRQVTAGRREEFRHFSAFRDPSRRSRIPDPQSPETFHRSRLRWDEREEAEHRGTLELYRELIALRRSEPALLERERGLWRAAALDAETLALRRGSGPGSVLLVVCFGDTSRVELATHDTTRAPTPAGWRVVLATEETRFGGGGGWGELRAGQALALDVPGAAVLRAG